MSIFTKEHVNELIRLSNSILDDDVIKSIQKVLLLNVKQEGDDVVKVRCAFCGTVHEISDIDIEYEDGRDSSYTYTFYHKCECGKHLSGERIDWYIKYFSDSINRELDVFSYREVEFKNCINQNTTNWFKKN